MKKYKVGLLPLVFISFFLLILPLNGESASNSIDWMGFEGAESLRVKTGKVIIVDVYKATCGWCKKMQSTTYADSNIQKIIEEKFIPVRLDVLSRKKMNVFGEELLERDIARLLRVRGTPTTIFVDSTGTPVVKVPGYIPPDQYMYLLKYVSGEWYEDLKFEDFYKSEKILEKERGKKE
mgnify:CR=1 FL=1